MSSCSIDGNLRLYEYFLHDFKTGGKTPDELMAFARDKSNALILRLAAFDAAEEKVGPAAFAEGTEETPRA